MTREERLAALRPEELADARQQAQAAPPPDAMQIELLRRIFAARPGRRAARIAAA